MNKIIFLSIIFITSPTFSYDAISFYANDKQKEIEIQFDVVLFDIFKHKKKPATQIFFTVSDIKLFPEQDEEELAAECQFNIQPQKSDITFPFNSIRVWGSYKKSSRTSPEYAKITLRKGIGLKSKSDNSDKHIYDNGLFVSIHANYDNAFAFLAAKMKNGQTIFPERVSDYGIGGSKQMVFSSMSSLPLSYIYYTWKETTIEEIFVKLPPQNSHSNPH